MELKNGQDKIIKLKNKNNQRNLRERTIEQLQLIRGQLRNETKKNEQSKFFTVNQTK